MIRHQAKTLIFDIELSPNLAWVYQKYETDVLDFDKYQWVQSVSFKWLGKDKTYTYIQPDFPEWNNDKFDDSGPLKKLYEAIEQSEIVVGHNVKKFDIKKINTRFLIKGMSPPRPYKVVDTLTVARSKFGFVGNSLNDLSIQLGIGQKLEKGVSQLWKKCINGDLKAWEHMRKYNRQDVLLTEKIYKILLPWMEPFPVVHIDNGKCRKCQGNHLIKRGHAYTKKGQFHRLQCVGCGSWSVSERITE